MADWQPPAGTTGDVTLIRASSKAVREDPRNCPTADSAALRPRLVADPKPPWASKPREEFALAPFMAALDLVELQQDWPLERVIADLWRTHGQFGSRKPPAHTSLLEWTAQALPRYVEARVAQQAADAAAGAPHTTPVAFEWVAGREPLPQPDARGAIDYEQTAWGRRYASADGAVRDLWIPSIGHAKENRPDAEKAALAYVLARGLLCGKPDYPQNYSPLVNQSSVSPERVRVFGYGCTDDSTIPLLDWDQSEVYRHYKDHAAPAFARVTVGTEVLPGSSCIKCKALVRCTELERTPGLWGSAPAMPRRARRSLSVWDMRLYKECPAQYHLTRHLHLKTLRPEPEGALRGRVVDAQLNSQHLQHSARGCRDIPGPTDPNEWSAGGHTLTGPSARQAAAMLAEHAAVCPLNNLGPSERILVQHQVPCYVPELDVVVIATPDLLYTRRGGWIWRETKTAASRLWEGKSLMSQYPQLALAVLLLASGALKGDLRRSRVELELLYADDCTLEELDPARPAVVAEARDVIAALADPLLSDATYDPIPGKHCHGCEAWDWCKPGRDFTAVHPPAAPAADVAI